MTQLSAISSEGRGTIAAAAALLARSSAPAIVGLVNLSLEACREAIRLAEAARAKLLPFPVIGDPVSARHPVQMLATSGDLGDAQVVIRLRHKRAPDGLSADLATILKLRAAARHSSADDPILTKLLAAKRAYVHLPAECDVRAVSQWHKFAAEVQQRVRLSVVQEFAAGKWFNPRGVVEAIAWQTGINVSWGGGVDFGDGSPRPCPDAEMTLKLGACDAVLIVGQGPDINLQIATAKQMVIPFQQPTPGTRCSHMRPDGLIMRLWRDGDTPTPDPTAALLAAIADQIAQGGGG